MGILVRKQTVFGCSELGSRFRELFVVVIVFRHSSRGVQAVPSSGGGGGAAATVDVRPSGKHSTTVQVGTCLARPLCQ